MYMVRKTPYDLKQGLRAWNNKIDGYFIHKKFKRSPSEPSLYIKKKILKFFLFIYMLMT